MTEVRSSTLLSARFAAARVAAVLLAAITASGKSRISRRISGHGKTFDGEHLRAACLILTRRRDWTTAADNGSLMPAV